ncbi:hypothetical protein BWQ96_09948 [Gracilariopsis chorda]|uniref:Uncharacterized protein n=1 Tax=Gracilariopsis chorda TaxID=448386 RepID=A0A2V3IGS8_9FLOR|nr:hypothetical protein BWQ96_09948 [Gracilariopsis chorda]|eukprot:PXF40350.1 hypothetical protein BWQ96_09948 [Gracilariopsis chorda]
MNSAVSEEDVRKLERFSTSHEDVSVEEAISVVSRIIENAALPSGATPSSVNAAKAVLSDLLQHPSPTAITGLLNICILSASIKILEVAVDVLVLSSAAWKALVAAFLREDASSSPAVAVQIITCALRSAIKMLIEVLSLQNGPKRPDPAYVSRCVRITKFYCINAAKCAKAFAKLNNFDGACVDSYGEMLANSMLLIALASHTLMFDNLLDSSNLENIRTEVCPYLSLTLRCIIRLLHCLPEVNSLHRVSVLFKQSVESFYKIKFFDECFRTPGSVHSYLILAVVHVMRSESCPDRLQEGDITPHSDLGEWRWTWFRKSLLPLLFQLCDPAYPELVSLRDMESDNVFLDTISSVVASNIVAACRLRKDRDDRFRIVNSLLCQTSSPNPACAHISNQSVCALYDNALDEPAQDRLLTEVVAYLRLSIALNSNHAERRWIPLATELLAMHYTRHGSKRCLSHVMQRSLEMLGSKDMTGMGTAKDQVTLRLLSSLSVHLHTSSTSDLSQGNEHGVKQQTALVQDVFTMLTGPEEVDKRFASMKVYVQEQSNRGDVYTWSHVLLPYLFDSKTTTDMALEHIKEPVHLEELCCALNSLKPSGMSSAELQLVCNCTATYFDKQELAAYPAIAAFISRNAAALGDSQSTTDIRCLCDVLELAVSSTNALKTNSEGRYAVLTSLTYYHAAMTIIRLHAPPCSRQKQDMQRKIHKTVLSKIKSTLKLIQWADGSSETHGGGEVMVVKLKIDREMRAYKKKASAFKRGRDVSVSDVKEHTKQARLVVSNAVDMLLNVNREGRTFDDDMKGEVESMQTMLFLISEFMSELNTRGSKGN